MQGWKPRARVTIQRRETGRGPINQPLNTWVDVATVLADVRSLSGIEAIKADAVASKVKASIRIRWRTDIDASMRVVHGSSIYNIIAVLPDHAGRQHVDLACESTT